MIARDRKTNRKAKALPRMNADMRGSGQLLKARLTTDKALMTLIRKIATIAGIAKSGIKLTKLFVVSAAYI